MFFILTKTVNTGPIFTRTATNPPLHTHDQPQQHNNNNKAKQKHLKNDLDQDSDKPALITLMVSHTNRGTGR